MSRPLIFINYRRDDTGDIADRLRRELEEQFPGFEIFLDHGMRTGLDTWQSTIFDAVDRALALIALVGPNWLSATGSSGQQRLLETDDYVRIEIERALAAGLPIFAVRTEGTKFPAAADLPPSIRPMLDLHQGNTVRTDLLGREAFKDDVGRLARALTQLWEERRPRALPSTAKAPLPQRNGALLRAMLRIFVNKEVPPTITRRLLPSPFLRDDPKADLASYAAETPLSPDLPYREICNWCEEVVANRDPDLRVEVLPGNFRLDSWGNAPGDEIREAALAAVTSGNKKMFDGPAVRVGSYHWRPRTLQLTLQRASYFAQLRSNLALDYRYRTGSGVVLNLRELLRHEYGPSLPPLSDGRMANTLGVAALIFVRGPAGELSPYILPRSKDVAVFNVGGEWHCTASGVVESPVGVSGIAGRFHYDAMLKELEEEVGLTERDLPVFRPVAFCREFARGGKPQMFFLGVTDLPADELHRRLVGAQKRAGAQGDIVENTLMPALRRPSDLHSASVMAAFHDRGFTPEVAACIHYFMACQSHGAGVFGTVSARA